MFVTAAVWPVCHSLESYIAVFCIHCFSIPASYFILSLSSTHSYYAIPVTLCVLCNSGHAVLLDDGICPFPPQFQLQVVRPFESEYTSFLGADQFRTEWYMSLRYKVSDLQATVFRNFHGPGQMNMTAAYHMMNATAQMMQNLTSSAAAGYQPMAEMDSMSPADQGMGEPAEMAQYGQQRYWPEHQDGAVSWGGYASRRGDLDNEVGVEQDAELFEAQKFRIDQKMKIYERMEQMYDRYGVCGPMERSRYQFTHIEISIFVFMIA